MNVYNRQRRYVVDTASLGILLEEILGHLGVDGTCSVALVSDRSMAGYNRRFRGKSGPTDVLSFADPAFKEGGEYLGDIVISVEMAKQQRHGQLMEEIKVLGLHGLLHLVGYDHEIDDGEMVLLENRLRQEFQLT